MESDSPVVGAGKRGRPPADLAARLEGPAIVPNKRYRRYAPRAASVANKEVVKGRAKWCNSELKSQVEASLSPAAGGAEAAIPASAADE